MEASDESHLKKAIVQLQIFLLSGLIAQSANSEQSPTFTDTKVKMVSGIMTELSQLSDGIKKKLPDIDWDYVELLKSFDGVRREILKSPHKFSQVLHEYVPNLLEMLKNLLNSKK